MTHPVERRSVPRLWKGVRRLRPGHFPALFTILLVGSLALAAPARTGAQEDAIFAIADIHGNYASLVALLTQIGLADGAPEWTGGEATLIQTGDYTDRGPEVRRVMDFLIELDEDAPEDRVVILLGNHEMMNMIGDLRDVTDADYESFRDADSENRRQEALREYLQFEARRRERLGLPEAGSDLAGEWLASHPPGFVEHRRAFAEDGAYGRWLRRRPVVVEEAGILFMHAGIHPALSELSIDEINDRVRAEIQTFDRYVSYLTDAGVVLPFFTFREMVGAVREELAAAAEGRTESDPARTEILEGFLGIGNWLSMHSDGVLWFRGFAEWSDEEGELLLAGLLERYDASAVVVGHTPQSGGQIRSRFGGRLYLADTGMLSSYYPGGRASVLEIRDGVFADIYLEPGR